MARKVPEGLVAFGWYTGGESLSPRTVTMGVRLSLAHLAPAEQAAPRASGRPADPYEALCGRRKRTRRGDVESPQEVALSANAGKRKWCERCWKLAGGAEVETGQWRRGLAGTVWAVLGPDSQQPGWWYIVSDRSPNYPVIRVGPRTVGTMPLVTNRDYFGPGRKHPGVAAYQDRSVS